VPEPGPFDLAVVLPLSHDHGFAEACLAGWDAQSHPRSRIQVVAIVEADEAAGAATRLRPLLRPWDLWLPVADDNDAVLYDRGARAAEAPVLLFSEAHCVPLPGAAAAAVKALAGGAAEAFSLRSGYLPTTAFGRRQIELEIAWYRSLGEGHWRSVSLRGLAVRRDRYVELGGFRAEHEHFCEMALGAALHRGGHRIVYSDEVLVLHGNAPTTAELGQALRSCARGQWRWREEMERQAPGLASELFGPLTRSGRIAGMLARRGWADGGRGAVLNDILNVIVRRLSALRLASAGLACEALVGAGPLGRWAYRAYWRAGFDHGILEAATAAPYSPRTRQARPSTHERAAGELEAAGTVASGAGSVP